MTSTARCPAREVLQQFILGALPPSQIEELAGHVEHCSSCTATLNDFHVEDTITMGLKNAGDAEGVRRNPLVQDLIEQVSSLRSGDGEAAAGGQIPSSGEIDFLAPAQGPDEIGRLGGYRILKLLGSGGMGVVFLAQDPQLERQLAIKAMKPSLAARASARERFLREAKLTAAIENDHVVPIHQVGEDRGIPFLAIPLLKGESLEARLEHEKMMSPLQVLRVGREIAFGLAAIHEHSLIHRDIKPTNIWLETVSGNTSGQWAVPGRANSATGLAGRCRVKIFDFGLARAAEGQGDLTRTGQLVGTPGYMAPEQARGETIDFRCDLFSLGSVLYRMCTGERAFKGSDVMTTLLALEADNPRPPHELNSQIPPELSELVMKLLSKDPAGRPASAVDVAFALEGMEVKLASTLAQLESLPKPTPPKSTHHRWWWGVVAGLGLAIITAILVFGRW